MIKKSDLYETPPKVFAYCNRKYGPFDVDVCAELKTAKVRRCWTIEDNSLEIPWAKNWKSGWMNPPYSDLKPWLLKARREAALGFRTTALLPTDTSTRWWHDNIQNNPDVFVELLPKRIHFLYKGKNIGSPKFGSAIVVFYPSIAFDPKHPTNQKYFDPVILAPEGHAIAHIKAHQKLLANSNADLLKLSPLPKSKSVTEK